MATPSNRASVDTQGNYQDQPPRTTSSVLTRPEGSSTMSSPMMPLPPMPPFQLLQDPPPYAPPPPMAVPAPPLSFISLVMDRPSTSRIDPPQPNPPGSDPLRDRPRIPPPLRPLQPTPYPPPSQAPSRFPPQSPPVRRRLFPPSPDAPVVLAGSGLETVARPIVTIPPRISFAALANLPSEQYTTLRLQLPPKDRTLAMVIRYGMLHRRSVLRKRANLRSHALTPEDNEDFRAYVQVGRLYSISLPRENGHTGDPTVTSSHQSGSPPLSPFDI